VNKEAEILLSLSKTDKELVGYLTRKEELVNRKESITSDLAQSRQELEALEADLKQGASRQALEEHRLRDEQQKIMDRRKQLTAIGGAKVAKMVEREIDIASRTLESMEENALRAVEEVDALNNRIEELRSQVAELEEQLSSQGPEMDTELEEIEGRIGELSAERSGKFDDLEPRLRHLYNRVQGRYPDSPVAKAMKVSCRSCFRALPNQTYNQILAGNSLIQCPGCQRILVYVGEEVEPN
jgi:predicted  nucleic acid-binding Zn-ribbon protein